MNKRRIFLKTLSGVAAASAAGLPLFGEAADASKSAPKVSESDPQAVSLGYKEDTTKVDAKKFPKHSKEQVCSGCQFFQGTSAEAYAPCTIFGGKQVNAKGWCSAYVKKA